MYISTAEGRPVPLITSYNYFVPAVLQAALWQYLGKIFGNRSLILSRGLKWAERPQNMQGKVCFKRWWFQIPSRPRRVGK